MTHQFPYSAAISDIAAELDRMERKYIGPPLRFCDYQTPLLPLYQPGVAEAITKTGAQTLRDIVQQLSELAKAYNVAILLPKLNDSDKGITVLYDDEVDLDSVRFKVMKAR